MSGERDPPLAGATGDGEVRLGLELPVDLHEVDAERDQRVDGGDALSRCASEDVRHGNVAAFYIWARCDDARADERSIGDLAAPEAKRVPIAGHVAHAGH